MESIKVAIKGVKTEINDPYSAKFSNLIVIHRFEAAHKKKEKLNKILMHFPIYTMFVVK